MEQQTHDKTRSRKAPAVALAAILLSLGMWEGREHIPYRDVAGILTVCDGITGPDVVAGNYYTDKVCDELGRRYVIRMTDAIGKCVGELNTKQWIAWGHFTYNTGTPAFCASTAAKLLRAGQDAAACAQIERWTFIKKNGRKVDCKIKANKCGGIAKRRAYERKLCEEAL